MDDPNETPVNFALRIRRIVNSDGIEEYDLKFINQGMLDTEVIVLLECWLEKFKDHFKDPIKEGIVF